MVRSPWGGVGERNTKRKHKKDLGCKDLIRRDKSDKEEKNKPGIRRERNVKTR